MLLSKQDLKFYIQEDRIQNLGRNKIGIIKYIFLCIYSTDGIMAYRFLKSLRKYEYAINCLRNRGIINTLRYYYYKYLNHKFSRKYDITIGPNILGYGFRIPHIIGGGIIINCKSIGNYCTANVGVVVGNKNTKDEIATIGNYVDMTTGCKIIGKVTIGDHVTIAPNSVVIQDVPANCAVSGIPAKIIKYYDTKVK